MADEDRILIKHLRDLEQRSYSRNIYTYSGFLSMPEQDLFLKNQSEFKLIRHSLFGGSELSERKIVVFGSVDELGYAPEYPVKILKVTPVNEKFAEDLNHRDYLGALMNLGIERSLLGDIVVKGKTAYIYCLDSILEFIIENLTRIRHTSVKCEEVSADVPELAPTLVETTVNVASERIDSIVSSMAGMSRSHIDVLFKEGKVFLNGKVNESMSTRLKTGDVLTVRGFGKAIYGGIAGNTRKGRLAVSLKVYR